jgi:cation diffusion facilitator family transporter
MAQHAAAQHEKALVALSSVGAAIGLTALKLTVGLLTGSLGILAETAHSGLDLVAALMTFFAVRLADRPPDATHHYGHAKVENLSAFFEAGLLLLTAVWIIYEAIRRLLFHEGHLETSLWAFLVMAISIVVDYSRSRALLRVARRLGSQALEADALHFSTDIWSSFVVIVGLLVVALAQQFNLPSWLAQADAVAALGVSLIVIWVSLRMAKETIDALMDRAPETFVQQVHLCLEELENVTEVRRVRLRRSGNKLFADVVVAAPRTFTFEQTHQISNHVEFATMSGIRDMSPEAEVDVVVHVEPCASPQETVSDQIHYLAERSGIHAHDIRVRNVNGMLEADFDVELHGDMSLSEAHHLATRLEQAILNDNPSVRRVTTHLEVPNVAVVHRQDVTQKFRHMSHHISQIADAIAGQGSAHDIHIYQPDPCDVSTQASSDQESELDLIMHTFFDAQQPLSKVHISAEEIKRALRQKYPRLGSIAIHTEPSE